jgi:hypothetical protein
MFHRVLRSGNEEDEHFGSRIVAVGVDAVKTDVLVRASYRKHTWRGLVATSPGCPFFSPSWVETNRRMEDAMRLSDAIRLGAMTTPQARRALWPRDEIGRWVATVEPMHTDHLRRIAGKGEDRDEGPALAADLPMVRSSRTCYSPRRWKGAWWFSESRHARTVLGRSHPRTPSFSPSGPSAISIVVVPAY